MIRRMRMATLGFLPGFLVPVACLAQESPPAVRSPQVNPDRTVTFRLEAPKAAEVLLTGDLVKGPVPFQKDGKGVWVLTVGPRPPDLYTYWFLVDGITVTHPPNRAHPVGMVSVPGDGPMPYDLRAVPHGEIREHWYAAKSLNMQRPVFIYTPPTYDRSAGRLPVLYLLHGAWNDHRGWTEIGRLNLILDNLIADGKLKPLVVVMPFGTRGLLEDLIPFVEANYRVYRDREHRAIAGASLGGGQALGIGLSRLDLFSRVAGLSSALRWLDLNALFADPTKINKQLKLLWVGCGRDDEFYSSNKQLADMLSANGVQHVWRSTDGAHTWLVTRRYLAELGPLLFP